MSVGDLVGVDGVYATVVRISGSCITVRFCDGTEKTYSISDIKEL